MDRSYLNFVEVSRGTNLNIFHTYNIVRFVKAKPRKRLVYKLNIIKVWCLKYISYHCRQHFSAKSFKNYRVVSSDVCKSILLRSAMTPCSSVHQVTLKPCTSLNLKCQKTSKSHAVLLPCSVDLRSFNYFAELPGLISKAKGNCYYEGLTLET